MAAFLVGAVGVVLYRGFVQKKKANALLAKQNDLLEHQKQEITDSIRYASLIQKATLPAKDYSDSVLPEHFVYYKPRDIVSGDFYWIDRTDNHIIVAAADCTGHGVPGAIVSMLGISTLTKIAGKMETPKADEILNELRSEIIRLLNPVGSADRRLDGMDIALVVIHTKIREMEYAGAYNPLYLVRDGQLIEKKANKMPIGLYVKKDELFTAHRIDYQTGDIIYLFSDGYSDQFGGTDSSKFKTKNFKNL
jgi:serine phosphatase RsbU (regulator of sigma subunit)